MITRRGAGLPPPPAAARRAIAAVGGALAGAARDLAAFAFPQRCPACAGGATAARLLCDHCRAAIPRLRAALCAPCLARGGDPAPCARHPRGRVWAAWVWEERAARLIHALKYEARPDLAQGLGAELAAAAGDAPPPDLVVGVPLHPARRRERGYNQAELLAEALSRAIGAPWTGGVLERTRATPPQARLGPAARRANLAGAFRVRRPEWVEGRSVMLVDDVITTGATFEAALAALAACGARPTGVALAWAQ